MAASVRRVGDDTGTTRFRTVPEGTVRHGRRAPGRLETLRDDWRASRTKVGKRRGPFSLLFGTPRNRDMKRRWPLSLLLLLLYGWLGFTTVADNNAPVIFPMMENRTFFPGILHGFTVPFNFMWQLFTDDPVTIYQAPNNGGWYNFGWLLGSVLLLLLIRFMFRLKFHIVRSKKIALHTPHRPDPSADRAR